MKNFLTILSILAAAACAYLFLARNESAKPPKGHSIKMESVKTFPLEKTFLEMTVRLPGDLLPYEAVDIYAKVAGFIETINADRGTEAKKDDLLAQLVAPELNYRLKQATAQHCAAEDLYQRNIKVGVPIISALDMEASKDAAEATLNNMKDLEEQLKYLSIRAPFDGVITTRYLHPGAFVIAGGSTGAVPIFRIEMLTRLRLVVPVPEAYVESVKEGVDIPFTVSAFPQRQFTGRIARISHSLALNTRTEPVELDVDNSDRLLAPGMFADIIWPMRRTNAEFAVPSRAIVTTTEKVFVIRAADGIAEWVDVRRGICKGDMVEIFGNLKEGDRIVADATDEIRPGQKITALDTPEKASR